MRPDEKSSSANQADSTTDGPRKQVRILGPAPAPVFRLRSLFRYHLQMSAESLDPIREVWSEVIAEFKPGADVEFVIDVDPYNMR